MTATTIVVTGDLVLDHHLYEGERSNPNDDCGRGLHEHLEWGGAALLDRLLQAYEANEIVKERRDKERKDLEKKGFRFGPRFSRASPVANCRSQIRPVI